MNTLRKRLQSGDLLLGTMVTVPEPAICEAMALTGFDWLFIDGEHGPIEPGDLPNLLAAAGSTPCLVRTPGHDPGWMARALDCGAAGIIAPMVNDADQATRIAQACRYPPEGQRGIGLGRAQGYGTRFQATLESANDQVLVVVQAEHRQAVENIESIARVPGIDCILIGPTDLAASYGKTGQADDPEIQRAMEHVCAVCHRQQIPCGIFGRDTEAVRPWQERGCRLVVAGIDMAMLTERAGKLLNSLRHNRPSA